MVAGTELPINRFATADQMAQELFGYGVVIISALNTGSSRELTNDTAVPANQSTGASTSSGGSSNYSDFDAAVYTNSFNTSFTLDPKLSERYSPAARRTLKPYEARLLTASNRLVA